MGSIIRIVGISDIAVMSVNVNLIKMQTNKINPVEM